MSPTSKQNGCVKRKEKGEFDPEALAMEDNCLHISEVIDEVMKKIAETYADKDQ